MKINWHPASAGAPPTPHRLFRCRTQQVGLENTAGNSAAAALAVHLLCIDVGQSSEFIRSEACRRSGYVTPIARSLYAEVSACMSMRQKFRTVTHSASGVVRIIATDIYVCLSVYLPAYVETTSPNFMKFSVCMLNVAVVWFSSDESSIHVCYVLPVLWMTSYFHIMPGTFDMCTIMAYARCSSMGSK